MTSTEKFSEEKLTLAFNAISCGTEMITEQNLKNKFSASREKDPENFDEFCQDMINKYDTDRNGSLNF